MFVTTGKVIEFKENYKNPPYNTKPLTENRIFKDEQEFISSIYSSGN
jgi:hypothetical protein